MNFWTLSFLVIGIGWCVGRMFDLIDIIEGKR